MGKGKRKGVSGREEMKRGKGMRKGEGIGKGEWMGRRMDENGDKGIRIGEGERRSGVERE